MNVETIKADSLSFTATLDGRNRITIPKDVTTILEVKKGDKLTLTVNLAYRIVK